MPLVLARVSTSYILLSYIFNTNYLCMEKEVFTGKYPNETLLYSLSNSGVNMANPRFEVFP